MVFPMMAATVVMMLSSFSLFKRGTTWKNGFPFLSRRRSIDSLVNGVGVVCSGTSALDILRCESGIAPIGVGGQALKCGSVAGRGP